VCKGLAYFSPSSLLLEHDEAAKSLSLPGAPHLTLPPSLSLTSYRLARPAFASSSKAKGGICSRSGIEHGRRSSSSSRRRRRRRRRRREEEGGGGRDQHNA